MAITIDKAIEVLNCMLVPIRPIHKKERKDALKLSVEGLKLLKSADLEGGPHTFKGRSVEECIFIRKADLQAGPLAVLLSGKEEVSHG